MAAVAGLVWGSLRARAPHADQAAEEAIPFPPPFDTATAERVRAAHAADAARGQGLAPTFEAQVAKLEEAEDTDSPEARAEAKEVARQAPKVATALGPEGWRALTSALAVAAVERVRREKTGAFFSKVLAPTGVVDAQGRGVGEGWEALAQVLHRVRILRLALSTRDDPEDVALADDERRLYYRWKVERAQESRRTVRMDALHRLRGLEPNYPATAAQLHIIRGE